ncbi:2-hydroxyacid dehydrogenase [Marinimicrococcus flavescens]|uniref:2-hydroxyacid dehydrogenase n=1 Tax=Marinimicrococcus flavescens TaxID=3031815 RepID=A0AAP3UYK9_9PROT|nr:2-hydroxyacid dehydrogenase [Marinimicrococcus flavescens]
MTVEIAAIGAQRPFVLEALEKEFKLHKVWDSPDKAAALAPFAGKIRGVISHGMSGLPTEVIEALPNLEICALNGVGLETTDLELARKRGIKVTITPVLYEDVADLAVVLGMSACRRIAEGDRFVRSGKWLAGRMAMGRKFSGKRAGILGLGRIGMQLARRLEGFGMAISYYDPFPKADVPYQACESALALAQNCDILFLAAAGGQGGGHIVTRDMLAALGPTGIFVNIARGWLVDEPAMVELLSSGELGAAGLDVFEREPTVPEALLALDNVVLTPHIASNTEETMQAMGQCVVDNISSWFAGKGALTSVT